ncbi:response regulator transcription factor [Streptococcus sp. H31]|uniref:response regulator transcription factor n=1 Tax=Streptococcus huangxiaojuni TaxID=3237239 RepID=UPI0034A5CFFD
MLDIYILEDDIIQQFRMEREIEAIMSKNHWLYQRLETFSSSKDIIAKSSEKGEHQIFFLDLEIKEDKKQGIEVAKAIREKDATAIIVFVTSHSEFMLITYQSLVGAIDFIDKNLNKQAFSERIELCLKEAMKHQSGYFGESYYLFETSKARVRIPYNDILYFETSPAAHRVILHTKNDRFEFYATIAEVAKSDKRLFKCHRSFVINVDNVKRFDKKRRSAYFETGDYCLVSRDKVKALLNEMR